MAPKMPPDWAPPESAARDLQELDAAVLAWLRSHMVGAIVSFGAVALLLVVLIAIFGR